MFDEKSNIENDTAPTTYRDTGYLGELALRTGGEIVYVPNNAFGLDGELGLVMITNLSCCKLNQMYFSFYQ